MSGTIARLLLALISLIASVLVFALAYYLSAARIVPLTTPRNHALPSMIWGLGFLVMAWILIWRGIVRWTPARIGVTVAAALFAAMAGLAVHMTFVDRGMFWRQRGVVLGGLTSAVCWLATTTAIWRETRRERVDRLRKLGVHALPCPNCGYNLAGLREARCPECGSQFTLNELFAASRPSEEDVE